MRTPEAGQKLQGRCKNVRGAGAHCVGIAGRNAAELASAYGLLLGQLPYREDPHMRALISLFAAALLFSAAGCSKKNDATDTPAPAPVDQTASPSTMPPPDQPPPSDSTTPPPGDQTTPPDQQPPQPQ
jgi:hypothetical protein